MSNIRRSLYRSLRVNENHVDASRRAAVALSTEEAGLLESLRETATFKGYPKDQLDRHTIKALLVHVSDSPVSVIERAARKAEILMARGALNENLETTNKKSLTEAEVPEERPAADEGEGDLPQGDADSLSSEHDGEDHENPGKEDSEAEDDGTKQGGERGDQSGTADKGYKDEKAESTEQHDEEDAFQLENDDEDEDDLEEEDEDEPKKESKKGKKRKMKEQDMAPPAAPEPPAAPAAPKMENDDEDADDLEEEGAEGSQNDAKDPAPEEDRAASDAKYKDGAKQNESEEVGKDIADTPDDYDDVEKEDPAKSELDKGPVDPKLESLNAIEKRICSILREAGIKKGSRRWQEAYQRGWALAMEHRVKKISG